MATKKGAAGGEGTEWLEALEERVRDATARLTVLTAENARLAKKVEELEGRSEGEGGAETWRQEREEIRGRVEKLTATLEGLLEP